MIQLSGYYNLQSFPHVYNSLESLRSKNDFLFIFNLLSAHLLPN